jgi:hypothetical protein
MCNCYALGKTSPCPFPADFVVDTHGYPVLNRPYDHHETDHDAFDHWLTTCCPHPDMDYLNLQIGSWKAIQAFRHLLASIGWQHFPVLERILLIENQGLTSLAEARFALQELNRFAAMDDVFSPQLIDTTTGEPVGTLVYGGLFTADPRTGIQLSYDETGFAVIDTWEFNRELFRAVRFTQEALEAEPGRPQTWVFTDLESGRRFVSSTPLKIFQRDRSGQTRQVYPQQLQVERRATNPADYDGVVDPLRQIFRASLEMGNPVRWE